MAFHGVAEEGEPLAVQGTYPASSGPDWGWRVVIRRGGAGVSGASESPRVVMVNISPDGKEETAVEAVYSR